MAAIPCEVIEVAFRPKFSHWHFPSKQINPCFIVALGTARHEDVDAPALHWGSCQQVNWITHYENPHQTDQPTNMMLSFGNEDDLYSLKRLYYFNFWVFELYRVECAWFVCVSPFSFACLRVDMILGKRQTSSSQQILSWTPSYKRTWDSTSSTWGRSLKSDPEAKLFRNYDALQNILIRIVIDKYLGLSWPYLLMGGVRRITANVMNFLFFWNPTLTSRNQQKILKNIVATHLPSFYDLVMINGFHLQLSI